MAIPNSIDPKSGYCSETKIYHSLMPQIPLPPETTPLSVTDYIFSLLLHKLPTPTTTTTTSAAAALIDAATRRRIPYPELILRVKTLAASLKDQIGLSKGDSVFILSPNSHHIPILYLSLFSIGVIVSPSNPTSSKPEISRQIDLCKPVIAFATSDTAHKIPSLSHRPIILDSPEFESMMTCHARTENTGVVVLQSDPAAILYSSGTTGKIKGVVLSHRNFIASYAGGITAGPVRSSPAVALCAVPYFHSFGFVYSIREISLGESVVSMGRFDLRLMMRAIEEFRVTHLALAPPVVVAMVRSVMNGGYDLRSLEVVLCGGAAIPNPVIQKFKNRFPNVLLVQAYGMTEIASGISRRISPEESRILGGTGRLSPNSQAKIVGLDTGTGLPPFKHGELWVRGPCIMKGYAGDKEATEAVLDLDGWLRSGDLCYFDSEGYLFYVERIKELIKYKGYQVAPAELEHLLHSHPDIDDAAVIPYPDEEAGQIPMAFVVRRSGSTTDESQIIDFVAKQVAPYKKLRRVAFVNSLPKNATGKLLRKDLIKLALSSASSKL